MNDIGERYLALSLKLLEQWLPSTAAEMLHWYEMHPDFFTVEINGLIFCLFSWPCFTDITAMEKCILLVFDGDVVVADMSGLHDNMEHILHDAETKHFIISESDWMDLEQYILQELYETDTSLDDTSVLMLSSVYVTKSYRKKGIFTMMENMMHEYALRNCLGQII